ncbi:hypothetical protein VP141O351_P0090 [Vibrio phage 141O35-1]|nr:hypothetical protein VP141O351_P0090 [Vibrio phage 141O35-1]CAH9016370.1 hypothetical protein VP141E351_P0090 [Vibrio phage 141E35-1]
MLHPTTRNAQPDSKRCVTYPQERQRQLSITEHRSVTKRLRYAVRDIAHRKHAYTFNNLLSNRIYISYISLIFSNYYLLYYI